MLHVPRLKELYLCASCRQTIIILVYVVSPNRLPTWMCVWACFHQQCVWPRSAAMCNYFSKFRSWPALPHANVYLHKSQLMFKLLIKNIIYLYMMIELEHGKGSPLKACLVCGNCWPKTKFGLSRKFCFYLIGGQKLACPQQILIHRATDSLYPS